MSAGNVLRLFSGSLQRLFRNPLQQCHLVEYCPYTGNNGCVMMTQLAKNRNMATVSSPGKSSRKAGRVDGGLDGALTIGKLSKKQRLNGKQHRQNGYTRKQNNLLFPYCKPEYTNPCVRNKLKEKTQNLIPTSSNRKVKSSFLASLGGQQRLSQDIGSSSVDGDRSDVIRNYTDISEHDRRFELDTRDTRSIGLETLDVDCLAGDEKLWQTPERHFAGAQINSNKRKKRKKNKKNKDRGLKTFSETEGSKKGIKHSRQLLKKDEYPEGMYLSGYEHLLYSEERYRTRSDEHAPGKKNSGTQQQTPPAIDGLYEHSFGVSRSQTNSSLLNDKKVPMKVGENIKSPKIGGNVSTTSFILVDDCSDGNITTSQSDQAGKEQIVSSSEKNDDVDLLIQTLQNERWEKLVQKKLDQQNMILSPFDYTKGILGNKPSSHDSGSKHTIGISRGKISEKARTHGAAQDQMEDYIFGSEPNRVNANSGVSLSSVPNNTALLTMNQVCVEELKPDVRQEQGPVVFYGRNEESEIRPVPEPMLVIRPNEIINRKLLKTPNGLRREEGSLSSTTALPSQHGRKGDKSSKTLSVTEGKGPISFSRKTQPKEAIEIWSPSKLLNRKKELESERFKFADNLSKSNSNSATNTDTGSALANNSIRSPKDLNVPKSPLSEELRKKLLDEFKKNYVMMQKEKLLKSLNSKSSRVAQKDIAISTSPNSKLIKSSGDRRIDRSDNKNDKMTLALENWLDGRGVNRHEDWACHREKLYHQETLRPSHTKKPRKKSKKKSSSISTSVSSTRFPDLSRNDVSNIQSKNSDSNSNNRLRFNPRVDTVVRNAQKSNGMDSLSYVPLSGQSTASRSSRKSTNRLCERLDELDGIMTLSIEPVVDALPAASTKRGPSKVVKVRPRTSPNVSANHISSLKSLSTNQGRPSRSPSLGTFETIRHRRHLSAMRRYHDRMGKEKEKEDRKRRKRKKRNSAQYSRTKRNGNSTRNMSKYNIET